MANDKVDQELLVRYELVGDRLGEGAYGIVWKAIDKKSGEIIALKKVFDAFQNATDAQRTFREIMYLQALDHENIIKLFNVMKASNNKDIYLVFEFMETDLRQVIPANILQPIHKSCVIYQCLKALKYIHSAGLIHRDLKPANILLDSNCAVKICDFGLARSYIKKKGEESKRKVLTDYIATRWYRAPEILLGSGYYTTGVDVWSMGCIIGEIIGGKPMFRGTTTYHQLHKIIGVLGYPDEEDIQVLKTQHAITMLESIDLRSQHTRNIEDLFSDAPLEAVDLLRKMLRFNPNKRISIEEALDHPFLESFRKSEEQPSAPNAIEICLDDDVKYDVDHYRNELYERISERKRQIRKILAERRKEKERAKLKKDQNTIKLPCKIPHPKPVLSDNNSMYQSDKTQTSSTRRPSFQYKRLDNLDNSVSKRRLSYQPNSPLEYSNFDSNFNDPSESFSGLPLSKPLVRTPSHDLSESFSGLPLSKPLVRTPSQLLSYQSDSKSFISSPVDNRANISSPTDSRVILQLKQPQSTSKSRPSPSYMSMIKPRPASTQSRKLSFSPTLYSNSRISTPTSTKAIIQKTPIPSPSAVKPPKKLPQWSSSSSIRRPASTKSILKTKYPTPSRQLSQASSSFMTQPRIQKEKDKPTQQLPNILTEFHNRPLLKNRHSFSTYHRKIIPSQSLRR